jgi:hypothetical protein
MGHKKQTYYKTDASDHEPDHITDLVFGNVLDTVFHDSPPFTSIADVISDFIMTFTIQHRIIYFLCHQQLLLPADDT